MESPVRGRRPYVDPVQLRGFGLSRLAGGSLPERLLVMTMHWAKGIEFVKVILADVGSQSAAEKARLSGPGRIRAPRCAAAGTVTRPRGGEPGHDERVVVERS
jgi:hypothetical protein